MECKTTIAPNRANLPILKMPPIYLYNYWCRSISTFDFAEAEVNNKTVNCTKSLPSETITLLNKIYFAHI